MTLWLGIFGALFVLGMVLYWLLSIPLRDLISVSDKKKNKKDA